MAKGFDWIPIVLDPEVTPVDVDPERKPRIPHLPDAGAVTYDKLKILKHYKEAFGFECLIPIQQIN